VDRATTHFETHQLDTDADECLLNRPGRDAQPVAILSKFAAKASAAVASMRVMEALILGSKRY
jgi:hypothetical protein